MAEPAAAAGEPTAKVPWQETLAALWGELPGLLNDRIELLSLELHRAGATLVQLIALIVAASILGVTAWLVLWGAVAMALVAAGLPTVLALGCALLLNLAAAAWAVARARRLLPLLRLPATRRHLMIHPSPRSPRPAGAPMPDEPAGPQPPLAH